MNRRRRQAGSSGFSLVEVMVAMLIASVLVTAVLGVSVTATQGSVKSTHRLMFDQAIAQVSGQLKNYVTACGCDKGGACGAGCAPPTGLAGPNTNSAGVATWYLNGAPGPSGAMVDSAGNVWALKCGAHTVTGVLSAGVPNMEAAPYNGSITYTVTWPGGSCAGIPSLDDAPQISFSANWTEP